MVLHTAYRDLSTCLDVMYMTYRASAKLDGILRNPGIMILLPLYLTTCQLWPKWILAKKRAISTTQPWFRSACSKICRKRTLRMFKEMQTAFH